MYSAVNTFEYADADSEMDDRDSLYFDTISVAGSEAQNNRKSLSQSRMTIYHSAVDLANSEAATPKRQPANSTSSNPKGFDVGEYIDGIHGRNDEVSRRLIDANCSSSDKKLPITYSQWKIRSWRRFKDGLLSVDFVLAYPGCDVNSLNHFKRQTFEANLENEGLKLEREEAQKIHFVKIHAPTEVLCRYCEILKIKLPIKKLREQEDIAEPEFQLLQKIKNFLGRPFQCVDLDESKFPPAEYRLHLEYSRNYKDLFDSNNPDFFDSTIRNAVIYFILERQRFSNEEDGRHDVGIEKLLSDSIYECAYPLHDGDGEQPGSKRHLLLTEWGAIKNGMKHQPLDTIKEYFGPKVALYFAWLGFYTHMLIPLSVVGLICFVYGLATLSYDRISNDICNDNKTIIMCPQCDKKCDFWYLQETCNSSKFNYLIDNNLTVFFAFFMSFWAVLYLELWKRYSSTLIHRWGLIDFNYQVEHPRPQYLARLNNMKKTKFNAIHKVLEPHVPFWKMKFPSYFISYSIVILFICLSIIAIFALIVYRMAQRASENFLGSESSMTYRILVLPLTAGVIDLIVISLLSYAYSYLAIWLTNVEYRRTQAEYDESLTIKNYLFEFVNYYSSLFYIAFLKGKFVGYPAKYNRIFGYRQEECNPGGCLMELCIQLVIIMMGKQVVNAIVEMLVPYLQKSMRKLRVKFGLKREDSEEKLITCNQWTEDYHLLPYTQNSEFLEYLEMILQFGFVTIFGVAFPLAPLFALLNNVLEMRLDALKILKFYRRPVAHRVNNIGVWYNIMVIVTKMAVGASAFIIAFSSNFIPKLVYQATAEKTGEFDGYLDFTLAHFNTEDFQIQPAKTLFSNVTTCRYPEFRNSPDDPRPYKRPLIYWHILAARLAFIVIFQNVVAMVQSLVAWSIPDTPGKLRNKIKREEYLTREIVIEYEKRQATEAVLTPTANGDGLHYAPLNGGTTISHNHNGNGDDFVEFRRRTVNGGTADVDLELDVERGDRTTSL